MPAPRKTAKKSTRKPVQKAAKKAAPPKFERAAIARRADGDAAVFAYLAQLSGEPKAIASKFDDIVTRHVPGVKRAMKWNVPFYGLEGRGWFCAFAAFKSHTSVNFFRGVRFAPVPPDGGVKENRRVAYKTLADVDEAQLSSWIRQASALPGWLAPPSRGGP